MCCRAVQYQAHKQILKNSITASKVSNAKVNSRKMTAQLLYCMSVSVYLFYHLVQRNWCLLFFVMFFMSELRDFWWSFWWPHLMWQSCMKQCNIFLVCSFISEKKCNQWGYHDLNSKPKNVILIFPQSCSNSGWRWDGSAAEDMTRP